ncbi:type IX secretion system membrane protein PorP/SprF, partial [Bacteroidota bacterium]
MKNLIIYICLAVSFVLNANGQDPQFSQFYSSPLYLGPSLAGAAEQSRLIANYRNQWANLPQAFSTYA